MLEGTRLLRPLNYLRITGQKLWRYNWCYPAVIALAALLYAVFYQKVSSNEPVGEIFKSIVISLSALLQIMPGFYIAALAAISTFNGPTMDTELSGTPVKLKAWENGELDERTLSRRRFLAYLFGYLSFLSLMLFIGSVVLLQINPTAFLTFCPAFAAIMNGVIFFLFLFFFCQMFILTLLGLFYLVDRMHWESPAKRL